LNRRADHGAGQLTAPDSVRAQIQLLTSQRTGNATDCGTTPGLRSCHTRASFWRLRRPGAHCPWTNAAVGCFAVPGRAGRDPAGKPIYDFTILDGIFDEYRAAGVRPMVEFGFMPKDLAASLPDRKEYQVHYPKSAISGASNNPPKDYTKWCELIRTVTQHLV